jgi:hypothetical protein
MIEVHVTSWIFNQIFKRKPDSFLPSQQMMTTIVMTIIEIMIQKANELKRYYP